MTAWKKKYILTVHTVHKQLELSKLDCILNLCPKQPGKNKPRKESNEPKLKNN